MDRGTATCQFGKNLHVVHSHVRNERGSGSDPSLCSSHGDHTVMSRVIGCGLQGGGLQGDSRGSPAVQGMMLCDSIIKYMPVRVEVGHSAALDGAPAMRRDPGTRTCRDETARDSQ